MPMIAAAAASAFAAVSSVAATVSAAVAASTVLSTAMTVIKVLSVASSIYSLTRKPKSGMGSPSPVAFKADPNAPITFVAGVAAVGGNMLFGQTHAPKNRFLTYITALSHGGPVQSVQAGFTAGDEVVTFGRDNGEGASGRYQDRMWQKFAVGAVGAAALAMTSTATKYTPARAGPLYEWTAQHKLSGLAHTMWTMWSDTERLPNGVPKPLWIVHGGVVYDPRKDSTYPGGAGPQRWNDRTTWSFEGNENPHLHALTFLIGHFYNGKKVGGCGVPLEQIDVASFVQGANVADANNWRLSYPWTTAMRKWDVLTTMLQAGGARPIARGAKISCVTNTPRVSLATIGEGDLVGDFSVTGSQRVRDRINTVIPRCRLPSLKWTVQPFGKVTGAVYVAEDGGKVKPRELEYEGVKGDDDGVQVRQLAAYDLTALREGLVATLPLTVKWLRLRAGDCITIDATETLMNGQKVVIIKRDFDPATAIVTVTVQSETDGKHAFALGQTDSPPPTPALTGVDPLVLEPPAPDAWVVEPRTSAGGGDPGSGGTAPVVIIRPGGGDQDGTFDEPSATEVLIRYRREGNDPVSGLPYPFGAILTFPPSTEGYEITGLSPGITYRLEIAYKARGITSPWADYGTVLVPALVATNTTMVGARPAADIVADLAAVPGQIDAAVAALDLALSGALADLNGRVDEIPGLIDVAVADLDARIDAVPGLIDAATAVLDARVDDLQDALDAGLSDFDGAVADLDLRVDALFSTLETPGTGVLARTASLETATTDLVTGKADASRVTLIEADVSGLAYQNGLRIEETIALNARAGTLETATADLLTGKADASRVTALEASLNTPTTGLLARTASLETATVDLVTGKADASRVTIIEADVGDLAYQNGLRIEETIALNARAGVLETATADLLTGKADASRVTTLEASLNTPTTGLLARVGTVEAVATDLLTGKADASRVTLLEARQANGPNIIANSDFRDGLNHWTAPTGGWVIGTAGSLSAPYCYTTVEADLFSEPRPADAVMSWSALASTTGAGSFLLVLDWLSETDHVEYGTPKVITAGVLTRVVCENEIRPAGATRVQMLIRKQGAGGNGAATLIKVNSGPYAFPWSDDATFLDARARVGTLETATADLLTGKADASRVTTLEAAINTPTTGIFARTGSLETATANLETGKAAASRVTILETAINTPTTGLLARIGTVETATTDLATGKADASRVSLIETDVSGLAYQNGLRIGETASLNSRAGILETATADLLTGKADASRVTTLEAAINTPTTGILARTGSLETATSNLETNKAAASRVTILETAINTPTTGLLARVGSVETATADLLTGKADASRVTLLEARQANGPNVIGNSDFRDGLARWSAPSGGWVVGTVNGPGAPYAYSEGGGGDLLSEFHPADAVMSWSALASRTSGATFQLILDWHSDTTQIAFGTVKTVPEGTFGRIVCENEACPVGATRVRFCIRKVGAGGNVAATLIKVNAGPYAFPWSDEATFVETRARVGTLETATSNLLTGKADASRVTTLETAINTPTTGILARTGSLETATSNLETNKAAASRVTTLETAINTPTTGLLARASSLETATADLTTGKADAGRVTLLEARQTNNPNVIVNGDFRDGLNYWTAPAGGWTIGTVGGPGVPYAYSAAGGDLVSDFRDAADVMSWSAMAGGDSGAVFQIILDWHSATTQIAFGAVKTIPNGPIARVISENEIRPGGATRVRMVLRKIGGTVGAAATLVKLNTGAVAFPWSNDATAQDSRARLGTVETATSDLLTGKADASRVTTLETAINTPTTGISARTASLETATSNLLTGKAEASRVTLVEARASNGPNLVVNGNFQDGLDRWTSSGGWVVGVAGGPGAPYCYVDAAGDYDLKSDYYPCDLPALSWSAFAATGGALQLILEWHSNTAFIQFGTVKTVTTGQFTRYVCENEIRPAAATRFRFLVRKLGGAAFSVASLIKVNTGAYAFAWSDDATAIDSRARVETVEDAVVDLYGRTYARWAVGAAVPGADAFIEARAETTPGSPPTSSVAIGAKVVAVYNQTGGDWKKALEVVGGNVLLTGGLQAGAFIRLGTGAGWPVALRAVDLNAADGGVVSFGTDLGALPGITFGMNNLDPLGAGETYDVRASGLTATGFTLYAKIVVPGTPSTFNLTTSVGTSAFGAGGIYIDKSASANASDGSYRVVANGTNHHAFIGRAIGSPPAPDDIDYVQGEVEVWALKSGSWVYVTSIYAQSDVDIRVGTGFRNESGYWSIDETVSMGDSVAAVGLRHATPDSYAVVGGFSNLIWTAPGTASSTRSATPSGQTTRITVRPS